jgi:putative peptidoglycan lipid II flippase
MVIAAVFGAGFVTDAFFVAFTIPNLLRRFFAEGSLTAAFVPTFSEVYHQEGREAAKQMFRVCWTLLLLILAGVTLLGILASPWVVKVIGCGFAGVEGKLALTDLLNRIMFPYIFFVSLLALLAGVLNVMGHFLLPALSPILLNLAMIGSALVFAPRFEQPILALAFGVLIGGVVQLLIQFPVVYQKGFDLKPSFNFGHPRVRQVARLMVPGIAGVAIYQINVIVTRILASFLPEGSVSWLYYGQRLFEFPQGIFIVSLAQAVLPSMSRQVAADDHAGFLDSLRFSLLLIVLVALPASVGLILCATPVYSLFFMGGAFTAYDVEQAALALSWFAPGLLFVGVSRIVAPTFYALKDTRTPVLVSFWTLLVNAGLGYYLMGSLQHVGLALALTLAAVFNAMVLMFILSRRLGGFGVGRLAINLLRLLPGLALMSIIVYEILDPVDWLVADAFWPRLGVLLAAVFGGVLAYAFGCWAFGVEEIRRCGSFLIGKLVRRRADGPAARDSAD